MRQQSDLHELAVFAKVVETGSFSATARAFGTTTSAVSKAIARLETRLGGRLLARTTRKVSVTDAGATLHASAVRILSDVAEAESAVARIGGEVTGTLRVSAPVMFGEHHVAPLLPALLDAHPHLRVDLSLSDRYVNLAEEGLDAAVRIGALADSSLVAIRIGEVDSAACASPAYLKARGTPRTPDDLARHECVRYSLVPVAREWRFRAAGGRERSVVAGGRLQVNHGAAIVRAAVAGAGIVRVPRFLAEEALARGELVEVLAAYRTKPSPIHVVHPSGRHPPPKLRVFVDAMRSSCDAAGVAKSRRGSRPV